MTGSVLSYGHTYNITRPRGMGMTMMKRSSVNGLGKIEYSSLPPSETHPRIRLFVTANATLLCLNFVSLLRLVRYMCMYIFRGIGVQDDEETQGLSVSGKCRSYPLAKQWRTDARRHTFSTTSKDHGNDISQLSVYTRFGGITSFRSS